MRTQLGTTAWSGQLARVALAIGMIFALGLMVAGDAAAIKKHGGRAKVSIGARVQAQGDLCFASGGSFSSGTNQFGTNVTTCAGGSNPQECVDTKKNTYCEPAYIPPTPTPLDGIIAQPPIGIAGRSTDSGELVAASDGGNHQQGHGSRERKLVKHGHGGRTRHR